MHFKANEDPNLKKIILGGSEKKAADDSEESVIRENEPE